MTTFDEDVDALIGNEILPGRSSSAGLTPNLTKNNNEEITPLGPKFGEIKFGDSEKVIKVVKISAAKFKPSDSDNDETKKKKEEEKNKFLKKTGEGLLQQLEEEWEWTEGNRPNLLISVTGGAWDFPFNNNIREVFRKGIVEAAESANAWVITGGTNVGVMKYVGTAVGDYETAKTNGKNNIETIGIVSWGKLRADYRNEIDTKLGKGNVVKLDPEPTKEKGVSSLQPNHSYFILVDDGTNKFGSDVLVRGGLEKAMSRNWKVSGLDEQVPVVCIVVEGGPNTIQQAKEAVENKIPIVVVADSGRASNIIAAAFDRPDTTDTGHSNDTWKENIKERLKIISKDKGVQKRCLEDIEAMMKHKEFHNVYAETSKRQIDQMILTALIKANKERHLVQLHLAQTWNRRDIVEYREILGHITETTNWENYETNAKDYQRNLHNALVQDQIEFVQMFLENNIVKIETYLTKEELAKLYKETYVTVTSTQGTRTFLPLLKGTEWENCLCTNVPSREELKITSHPPEDNVLGSIERILQDLIAPAFKLITTVADGNVQILPDPHRQLFLFAVLNKYYKMAEFFWEQGQEHIATALAASGILRTVGKSQDSELREKLQKIASGYEDMACKVLAECEEQSEENDTEDILKTPTSNWGFVNPLKLADLSESLKFIVEPPVQRLLNTIWSKGLEEEGKIYVEATKDGKSRCEKAVERVVRSRVRCEKAVGLFEKAAERVQRLSAPGNRFIVNVIFYVAFLAYFSWIMVSDKISSSGRSVPEGILIFWVFTFITEEIRQALPQPFDAFGERPVTRLTLKTQLLDQLKLYFSNMWNYIDIVMLSLFIIGQMARSDPNAARIFLAFSLVVFYLRFLRILTVIKNIGPKVLMIFKTLIDFKAMVLILLIVLIGYGTAVHAILFPHLSDSVEVAKGIFFRPLFQIYGNLFLDDLTATETSGMCTNNKTEMTTGYKQACPQNVGWGVFFLVMYMILSNVLLLNIFIAIFSIACENIQNGADFHWAFQFFNITEEYYNRPRLPPPFIIISHMRRLMCALYSFKTGKTSAKLVKQDMKRIKMEERCAYNFIRRKQLEQADDSRERILARLRELENMLQKSGPKDDNSLSWWY
ncbi:transient receptor potential cation channel subfamily M member-like 2 [Amphiura filiformis]|uniref:transient receptor potential cation channel subfamily M member-like 2 n=1 Tax=Amphiura filiformis TaxID=82378 RepID=UPI003B2112C6